MGDKKTVEARDLPGTATMTAGKTAAPVKPDFTQMRALELSHIHCRALTKMIRLFILNFQSRRHSEMS